MKLLIFIVTYRRTAQLEACCRSVADALPEGARVKVVVNGPDPESVQWLESFAHPAFQFTTVPKTGRAELRNLAFEEDNVDVVHFLDDDVTVPPHLFRAVLERFRQNAALDIVGGPNLTPPDSPHLGNLFGAVMRSFLAAPTVRSRYGAREASIDPADERHLILCNLALRRASVPAALRFQRGMPSNEENLLLYQLGRRGCRAAFFPDLFVFHCRRETIAAFARQIFSYGRGRAWQTIAAPASVGPLLLFPLAAVVAAIALSFIVPCKLRFFGSIALYTLLSLAGGFTAARRQMLGAVGPVRIALLTPVVHLSYGCGFLSDVFVAWWNLRARLQPRMRSSPAKPRAEGATSRWW